MRMMLAVKAVVSVAAVAAAVYSTRVLATGVQTPPALYGATALAQGHFGCCGVPAVTDQENFWDLFSPTIAAVTPAGISDSILAPEQEGAFAAVGGLDTSNSQPRRDLVFLHGSVHVSGTSGRSAISQSSWTDTITFTCSVSPCTYHATIAFKGHTTGTSTPPPDSIHSGNKATGQAILTLGRYSETLSSDDIPIGILSNGVRAFSVTRDVNWTFAPGQTETFQAFLDLNAFITVLNASSQLAALDAMDTFEFFLDPITEGASYTTASGVTYFTPAESLDTVAPTTTATLPVPPNVNGWAAGDVAVNLSATDNAGGSGVKQITYSLDGPIQTPSTVVSGNAAAITAGVDGVSTLTFFAEDNANNVEVANTLKIQIDKTPPSIASTRSPAANANGWNNSPVVVAFQCTDQTSGLAAGSPPVPSIVSTPGTGQSVTGTCTDLAGNSGSLAATNINIDLTSPTIGAERTPPANQYGWNNTPVTVVFTCADDLSGLAAGSPPAVETIASQGASQSVKGACSDRAGNSSTASVEGISIDTTSPTVTYAGNAGLYTIDQTVNITCSAVDPPGPSGAVGSGLASSGCGPISGPAYIFPIGTNSLTASATDRAGNGGRGSATFVVAVTTTSLCVLTKQFVEGSTKFSTLPPAVRAQGDQLVTGLCQRLGRILSTLTPTQKAQFVALYQADVAALVRTGWLTSAQGAVLVSLSRAL